MKLIRYGLPGEEKPGLVDNQGNIRDLSAHIPDITGAQLGVETLKKLRALAVTKLPLVEGSPRIGPCVGQVGKFIGVGLNYSDHAAETGQPVPTEPILFQKAATCIVGPNDDVMLPKGSTKTDWEVELGVIIGTKARYVEEGEALKYVAGYCVVNDVSEREFQMERLGQWTKGKSADTFGPIGPWLVTTDEMQDTSNLSLFCNVNGTRRQTGNTQTMVFNVPTLISYISRFMTLMPGDIIATGTPPGVALGMKPPLYLKAGDEIYLGVEGLGEQRQKVVAFQ